MKSDAHQMYASASRYSFSSLLRSVGEGWSQFWHEHARVGHLDGGRNPALGPVLHTLHTPVFREFQQLRYLGGTAQVCD